jgi:hypothetical protein
MSPIVGVDLVANPNMAMDTRVAVKIMFEGMERGSFTAHKLSAHINDEKTDYYNARRIINGVESAAKVATYAKQFEAALRAAGYDGKPYIPVRDEKPETPPKITDRDAVVIDRKAGKADWLAALINALMALLKGGKK